MILIRDLQSCPCTRGLFWWVEGRELIWQLIIVDVCMGNGILIKYISVRPRCFMLHIWSTTRMDVFLFTCISINSRTVVWKEACSWCQDNQGPQSCPVLFRTFVYQPSNSHTFYRHSILDSYEVLITNQFSWHLLALSKAYIASKGVRVC